MFRRNGSYVLVKLSKNVGENRVRRFPILPYRHLRIVALEKIDIIDTNLPEHGLDTAVYSCCWFSLFAAFLLFCVVATSMKRDFMLSPLMASIRDHSGADPEGSVADNWRSPPFWQESGRFSRTGVLWNVGTVVSSRLLINLHKEPDS